MSQPAERLAELVPALREQAAHTVVGQVNGSQLQRQRRTQRGDGGDHVVVTSGNCLELRRGRQLFLELFRAERARIYRLDDRCQRAADQRSDQPSADGPQAGQSSLIEVLRDRIKPSHSLRARSGVVMGPETAAHPG
jgi:hypothetical protein